MCRLFEDSRATETTLELIFLHLLPALISNTTIRHLYGPTSAISWSSREARSGKTNSKNLNPTS